MLGIGRDPPGMGRFFRDVSLWNYLMRVQGVGAVAMARNLTVEHIRKIEIRVAAVANEGSCVIVNACQGGN